MSLERRVRKTKRALDAQNPLESVLRIGLNNRNIISKANLIWPKFGPSKQQKPLIYRNQGGMKCSFFGKFDVFCFLVTFVLKFVLMPYYRRIRKVLNMYTYCQFCWRAFLLFLWTIAGPPSQTGLMAVWQALPGPCDWTEMAFFCLLTFWI